MKLNKSRHLFNNFLDNLRTIFNSPRKAQKLRSPLQIVGLESLESREVLSVTSFVGQVAVINAPRTVEVNKLEDNNYAKVFTEQQNVTLSVPLTVDASKVGSYSHESSFKPANILAGTKVNSYYLHVDRVGVYANAFIHAKGSITFNEPILGIVATQVGLNQTDYIGSKTTIYPKVGRIMDATDLIHPEVFAISSDRKTITFDFQTSGASDDVRIITAATPLSVSEVDRLFFKTPEAVTGSRTLAISAPRTVAVNNLENANYGVLFAEKTGVMLASSLNVDAAAPGKYFINTLLSPQAIQSGTKINSYYLHVDRDGTPPVFRVVEGSVTFDSPILGVIAGQAKLNNSDYLGASGTFYPKAGRQMDLHGGLNNDTFSISPDRKTLTYRFQTNTASDDIRIITSSTSNSVILV